MQHARRPFISGSILVVIWLVVCSAIGIVTAKIALHPARKVEGAQYEELAKAIASRNHAVLTDVSISAADGVTLRAWNIRSPRTGADAVILLHGQSDNRAGMLGNGDLLLRHGYSVLMPDARAHGLSGGNLATYGVWEANDIRRWFDWLERAEAPHCIDGLGESMGAGQLLQSLREVPGFCAVVAESPFASFREASYDHLGELLQMGAWAGRTLLRPAIEIGFLYARWKNGIDLEKASPQDAVAESKVPVLLIHGLQDTNLPPRHSESILARSAARGYAVALWEPQAAGHCGAAGAEPEEYERRVIGWFEVPGEP